MEGNIPMNGGDMAAPKETVPDSQQEEQVDTSEDVQNSTTIQSEQGLVTAGLIALEEALAAVDATVSDAALVPAGSTVPEEDLERICWICLGSDEENQLANWLKPCKCSGTTKWVHSSCLFRWVDEKQKGNAFRAVSCPQCKTNYLIILPPMSRLANILEALDNLMKRSSTFLVAGIFVSSIYWTAVTFGAVTVLQVIGHKEGLSLMQGVNPILLLIGLPAIPIGLVCARMFRWENSVLYLIQNGRTLIRNFPIMRLMIQYSEGRTIGNPISSNTTVAMRPEPISPTRILCGALMLPTISCVVGRLFFESVDSPVYRALIGGFTFITLEGILKIYLKQQQLNRKLKRRIVDYTEENIRASIIQSRNSSRIR